jgi:hypothetical protein
VGVGRNHDHKERIGAASLAASGDAARRERRRRAFRRVLLLALKADGARRRWWRRGRSTRRAGRVGARKERAIGSLFRERALAREEELERVPLRACVRLCRLGVMRVCVSLRVRVCVVEGERWVCGD